MIYETGIIGAILISLIALSFLVRGYAALQRLTDVDDKLLAAALFSILFTLVANFFFQPVLLVLPGSVLFWLFGAVLLRVYVPFRPGYERGMRLQQNEQRGTL